MGYERRRTPTAQLYDLPIIGDDFAKIGRIIDIYATPCSPYFEVWVYGFFQAIPTLFLTLTKPEFIDIDVKKGGHRPRKGKKARFRASAVFRDALIIIPTPRWVVFRVYEMFQRYGWYLLVADAVEDFALNWISMAYKANECPTPFTAYQRNEADHLLQGSADDPVNRPIFWSGIAGSNCNTNGTWIQPLLNGQYRITWTANFSPWVIPSESELPVSTQLIVDGQATDIGDTDLTADGNSQSTGSGLYDVFGPPWPQFWISATWTNTEKFCYVDGQFSVDRIEGSELGPDP